MIRKDRSEAFKQKYGKNSGGGIAIYYRSELRVEKKPYLTDEVEEILWVQVKAKESFILGAVYRSEYTNILDESTGECKIEENVRKATEISNRIIITGDFNIDTADNLNIQTQTLNNIYKAYNLTQLIKKPTRIDKKSGKATTIDHIWVNKDMNLINKAGTFIGVSDHFGTYLKVNMKKLAATKEEVYYRSYKNYSASAYHEDLERNLHNSRVND